MPGQVLKRRRQQRRVVERLRAHDFQADSGRKVTEADIDVVKDLDVVAEEADGLDHDRGVAFLAQRGEGVLHRGTDPGSAGHALALKGEKPVGGGEAQGREQRGHVGRRSLGFDGIRVWTGSGWAAASIRGCAWMVLQGTLCAVKSTGASAPMRAERLCHTGCSRSAKAWASSGWSAQPSMKSISMAPAGFGKDGAAIESHAGAGILWRKTDSDRRGNAILSHLAHHVGDVRLPVAHADIDREAERLGKQASLLQGELGQRARSNQTVTVTNLFDHRFGHGASAGDIAQVLGNLIERLGRSVGEQQNRLALRCDIRHGNDLRDGAELAHVLHHSLHIFDRGAGNDAVAKIEDVSGPAAGLLENLAHALAEQILVGEEQ